MHTTSRRIHGFNDDKHERHGQSVPLADPSGGFLCQGKVDSRTDRNATHEVTPGFVASASKAVSTITEPTASPNESVAVRNRSSNQSIGKTNPINSNGKPTALRTISMVTKPALGIPAALDYFLDRVHETAQSQSDGSRGVSESLNITAMHS